MFRLDRTRGGRPVDLGLASAAALDVSTKLLLCGFAVAVWGWLEASLAVAPQPAAEPVVHSIAQGLSIPILQPAPPSYVDLAGRAETINATR